MSKGKSKRNKLPESGAKTTTNQWFLVGVAAANLKYSDASGCDDTD